MNICPCCKRRIPEPKAMQDKRLTQDLLKARLAIEALESASLNPWFADLSEAIESEHARLLSALADHRLLWAIYRRNDRSKQAPYYAEVAEVAA